MPSAARPRELRTFLRRLPLALGVAALLWLGVRDTYGAALAWMTQGLARLFEAPAATQIQADGDAAVIGRRDMRADSGRLRYGLTQVHFNLVPFLALLLALRGWARRDGPVRLVAALAVLFASHMLNLLWHVEFFFATAMGVWSREVYSDTAREVYGGLRYFFDIPLTFTLPLLLWVGFFHELVLPMLGVETEDAAGVPPRR
jgi:hypothetical protein